MEGNKLKVGVFADGYIDQFGVSTAQKMVQFLQKLGVETVMPPQPTGSGMEMYFNGDTQGAFERGDALIAAFRGVNCVVCTSSGVVAYMRRHLRGLFAQSALHAESVKLGNKFVDICDFLVNGMHFDASGITFPYKVAWVDHGRTLRDYGMKAEPRQLLRQVANLDLVEAGELDMDFFFASDFTPVAVALLDEVIDRAVAQNAHYLCAGEPSLILLLNGRLEKRGLKLKCRHIIDILCQN